MTFVFCLIFLGVFVRYSHQLGFVDTPNSRSSHSQPTPSGSGIVIFMSVFFVSSFVDLNLSQNYYIATLSLTMILILGVFDDLKNAPARQKLIVITLSALITSIWGGVNITNLGSYFGHTAFLGALAIPFTAFAIVGFTNAFNLIDGLDGLATTISILFFAALWYIGYKNGDALLSNVTLLMIPALFAFLVFNWNPAKTFMGDSGSLTLGFLISLLCIKALNYVSPVAVLYIVAFPVFDTAIIMIRRKKYGLSIFTADKNHVHHVLLNVLNGSVRKTVFVIALVQLCYILFALLIVPSLSELSALLFFILNLFVWYQLLTKNCVNHKILLEKNPKA